LLIPPHKKKKTTTMREDGREALPPLPLLDNKEEKNEMKF
jgi:hypothetical protein